MLTVRDGPPRPRRRSRSAASLDQRGNRREPIFFEDGDQEAYLDLLAEQLARRNVEVWAYCLMSIHLILTPRDESGIGLAVGESHRRYTNCVNARGRWSGHLFQSRFASVVMDEAHVIAAARHVPMNPVRAGLVSRPQDWPQNWVKSSARAHLGLNDDPLVSTRPLLDRIGDFTAFLFEHEDPTTAAGLRAAEGAGRPLGNARFIEDLERILGLRLAKARPRPKPRIDDVPAQQELWGQVRCP